MPDHTTISRRAVTLPVIQADSVPHGPLHLLIDSTGDTRSTGQVNGWRAKHGAKSRRKMACKLHLARLMLPVTHDSRADLSRDQDADDPSQVAPLLNPD